MKAPWSLKPHEGGRRQRNLNSIYPTFATQWSFLVFLYTNAQLKSCLKEKGNFEELFVRTGPTIGRPAGQLAKFLT